MSTEHGAAVGQGTAPDDTVWEKAKRLSLASCKACGVGRNLGIPILMS